MSLWSEGRRALTSCSVSTTVCRFMRLASSSSHLQEARRTGSQRGSRTVQASVPRLGKDGTAVNPSLSAIQELPV